MDEEAVRLDFEEEYRAEAARLAATFTGDPLLKNPAAQVGVPLTRSDSLDGTSNSRSLSAALRANLENSVVL